MEMSGLGAITRDIPATRRGWDLRGVPGKRECAYGKARGTTETCSSRLWSLGKEKCLRSFWLCELTVFRRAVYT